MMLAQPLLAALGGFIFGAASICLALLLWIVPPVRRWTLRWPLFFLTVFAGLLVCGAAVLSRTPAVDLLVWSPMIMSGFALMVVCGAALVVRALEWYLWAYWR